MPMSSAHLELFYRRIVACGCTEPRTVEFAVIARRMNAEGYRTFRDQPWTADRVRSFLKNRRRRLKKKEAVNA